MIVMGGIVGAGIFINPSEVAHRVHMPGLILGVWALGGVLALFGAFIWAELATRLPGAGGQYLYLREAWHPAVAFLYGWVLLLVTQTGGMAAVAVTFAAYFRRLAGVPWDNRAIAAAVLLGLTAINCFGARAGSNVQSALMLLKLSVNFVCLRVLGPAGLDRTGTPASEVMRIAMGERGAQWIAVGIAISTLGFLSQGMLTAPRVYYAMARDGVFFERVGRLSAGAGAPITAIVLQGILASVIACSGKYGEILNFEVTVDFISFGMTAAALFVFRRRQAAGEGIWRAPGHPITTAIFVLSCAGIVGSAIAASPVNSAIALGVLAAGIPVYWYWSRR